MAPPIEQDEKDKYRPIYIVELWLKSGLVRVATRDIKIVVP
jgi:hypothetical protein